MMDVDDTFAESSRVFLQWLKASGALVSGKIELVDLRQHDAGRGVVAAADIEADEELFRIPRNLVLSVQSSNFALEYPELFERVAGEPWLELVLVMLYEHGRGSTSTWKSYFNVLPAAGCFDTLMYWDEVELKELEASAVVGKIGREKADETFSTRIWPIVRSQPDIFGYSGDVGEREVLQMAHRMASLIMAYAFDIESEREREIDEEGYVSEEEDEDLPKGMVPLADMLNADGDRNNARLFYEQDALVMKAVKPVTQGEELFNDYGPLPRSDLLRRYGYITDNYAQYDVLEIPVSLILETAKQHLGLEDEELKHRITLLDLFDETMEEGYDIYRLSPEEGQLNILSPSLKLLITLLTSDMTSLPPNRKPSKLEKEIASSTFGQSWFYFLKAILEKRRKKYERSLEEDRQNIEVYKQRLGSGMWLNSQQATRRRLSALKVRVGEKEILEDALGVLGDHIQQPEKGEKRKADSEANGRSTPKKSRS